MTSDHVNSNCTIHTATPDTTQTGLFCRVWCGGWTESARPSDRCVLCLVKACWAAQCDRRTHSDAERTFPAINSHRHTRQDKTAPPACRPPPRRRPGRQLCLAARPPTRSDVVRHEKHTVDCCIWLNLNFFSKRHATRVIYRLTVQTARRSWDSIHTARHDTDMFCRVWRAVWRVLTATAVVHERGPLVRGRYWWCWWLIVHTIYASRTFSHQRIQSCTASAHTALYLYPVQLSLLRER